MPHKKIDEARVRFALADLELTTARYWNRQKPSDLRKAAVEMAKTNWEDARSRWSNTVMEFGDANDRLELRVIASLRLTRG